MGALKTVVMGTLVGGACDEASVLDGVIKTVVVMFDGGTMLKLGLPWVRKAGIPVGLTPPVKRERNGGPAKDISNIFDKCARTSGLLNYIYCR